MKHQSGRKKLNRKSPHRVAMLRNQVISLIMYGHITSTKARIKQTKRLAEKLVTIARKGKDNITARRRALALLPYKADALVRLFTDIAPQYLERPGGYTRMIPLGRRISDTSFMARLEWV